MNKFLHNILSWTISDELKQNLVEIKPIDFHSHIWNILQKDNSLLLESKPFPVDIRTIWWTFWKFEAPSLIIQKVMHLDFVDNIIKKSWVNRNNSANLTNYQNSLSSSFIDKAVCLPIPPYQTFDDLKFVSELTNNTIAFTWVDFSKKLDFDALEKQFESDVKSWAKWLKIHPILQWISPEDKDLDQIVKLFSKYDLPIIFHTWVTEYSTRKNKNLTHRPEFWEIKRFIEISKNNPEAKIVIWHSGLFQVDEVMTYLSKYPNVMVDTSFQSKQKILELLNSFWEERLMFASDWPYWDRIPAVNVMHEAVWNNQNLFEKIMKINALKVMNLI